MVNMVSEVKDEDNIKQDMSIDVYGRKEADEKAAVRGNCAAAEQEVLIAVCAWMAVRRLEKAAGRNGALLAKCLRGSLMYALPALARGGLQGLAACFWCGTLPTEPVQYMTMPPGLLVEKACCIHGGQELPDLPMQSAQSLAAHAQLA